MSEQQNRLMPGLAAPTFTLPDTENRSITLDPTTRPATVVVFTSNACPYALAWHDRIQRVTRDYADRDVLVLQLVSNDETERPEDGIAALRERVATGDLAGTFLRDAEQSVARAYGATATPEVFVIDRAGIVRYHGAPDGDHDDPTQDAGWLRAALDEVLADEVVSRPSTSPAGCSIKWRVELLWWDGCPSHDQAEALLRETLAGLGREDVPVVRRQVRTRAQAQELDFPGSPTFQVGRQDLYPADGPAALTCRVYRRPGGGLGPLPGWDDLADRLRSALARPWDLPGWVDHRKPRK